MLDMIDDHTRTGERFASETTSCGHGCARRIPHADGTQTGASSNESIDISLTNG